MSYTAAFIVVFVLAFSITLILTPLASALGRRWNVVARFGGRHQTEGDQRGVSKLGGIALFGGFMVTALVAQALPVPRLDPYEVVRLAGLVIGGTLTFVFGLLDDIFEFRSRTLFMGQYAAAAVAIAFQIFIETLNNPLTGQQTAPCPSIVTDALSFF